MKVFEPTKEPMKNVIVCWCKNGLEEVDTGICF